jgi:hypothetical protein
MTEQSSTTAAVTRESDNSAAGEESTIVSAKDGNKATLAQGKVEASAQESPTLREIFSIPEKATDAKDDHWQAFQEKLAEEAKGIKWTAAMPDLGAKICELLDIKIHDILLAAWKKVEALRKVLEDSKQTPDKSVYLDLAEHSIDYETKPFIDVKIKGASVKKLTLHVALNLKLKGFVLKVRNGAIRELQTGNCEGKGTIKYGTLAIAEKKLEPIKFPLSIRIPSLIAIPEGADEEAQQEEARPQSELKKDSLEVPAPEPAVERIEL